MATYEIKYGLGGGFGGAGDWEKIEASSLEEAEEIAYEEACRVYESYDGMYGLLSFEDIQEENPDWDDVNVEDEWYEQRQGWLDYAAREVS